MSKRPSTKDLVDKIEKITRDRMAEAKVVSIDALRALRSNVEPLTILVIEDDETMRHALRRILEHEGYRVVTAADGTQLNLVLDDSPLDLIILDIGLPWINGFELAELMKAHDDLKEIPLIFVSGRTNEADVKRGFDVGADDFIKKPFEVEKVVKTVNTLMRLARR